MLAHSKERVWALFTGFVTTGGTWFLSPMTEGDEHRGKTGARGSPQGELLDYRVFLSMLFPLPGLPFPPFASSEFRLSLKLSSNITSSTELSMISAVRAVYPLASFSEPFMFIQVIVLEDTH